ncbi:cAAX protease family protein [Burkholderia thailandensis]|uniref:CAAX protease family protein n=1 Tax=Burkholderia thailandensis TaxID=57975 RepID=A0AAW9CW79_BURTH|nr:cAAX protease family protein [Burkholderia thailandensis]MDW9253293.1 cAAX protease family protein [Burkholderia thailandensis]PNE78666.1 hypothetical protein A8H37_11145 [Burkholderia thailandensis]
MAGDRRVFRSHGSVLSPSMRRRARAERPGVMRGEAGGIEDGDGPFVPSRSGVAARRPERRLGSGA